MTFKDQLKPGVDPSEAIDLSKIQSCPFSVTVVVDVQTILHTLSVTVVTLVLAGVEY